MREQSPGFKKEFDVSEYYPEMYGFDQRRPLKLYDIVELDTIIQVFNDMNTVKPENVPAA